MPAVEVFLDAGSKFLILFVIWIGGEVQVFGDVFALVDDEMGLHRRNDNLQGVVEGMGVGIILSSLTTKYRDLQILVSFGVSIWMYATPVIYPVDITSNPKLSLVLKLNPLQSIFTDTRYMITGMGSMDWTGFLYTVVFTLFILFLGIIVFNRQERTFMDTI